MTATGKPARARARDDIRTGTASCSSLAFADTDAEAERIYGPHGEYFFNKLLYTAPHYQQIPGCLEYEGWCKRYAARSAPRSTCASSRPRTSSIADSSWSAAEDGARENCSTASQRLRIGHLLTLLHFGSMPTELCKRNIDLFAREVLPHLAPQWDDKYEDRWWPERSGQASGRSRKRRRLGRRILRARHGKSTGARLKLWQGRIETEIEIDGSGPPLVWLHGPWGLNPIAHSLRVWFPAIRSTRPDFPAPRVAIPMPCTSSKAGTIWSSIAASCSTHLHSRHRRSPAIPSAVFSLPKSQRPHRSRLAGWCWSIRSAVGATIGRSRTGWC